MSSRTRSLKMQSRQFVSVTVLVLLASFSACSSRQTLKGTPYAEIDATVDSGCNQRSAEIRELRDSQSKLIRVRTMPIRVLPGVYHIGIGCGFIYRSDLGSCSRVEDETDSSVPPYNLVLRKNVRYVFSCERVGEKYDFRLVEEAL